MSREHIAICAGSFDPPTNGHLNIIERGLRLFDRVVVAVADNTTKSPTLSTSERVELLRQIFRDQPRVEVDTFDGLLVHYARKRNATVLLRGIRNMSDYEYESQMALANRALDPTVDTVHIMTEGQYAHLSSSIIKEIILCGGSATGMVHPLVEQRLREKLKGVSC